MDPNGEAQIRFPGGKGSRGYKIKNAVEKKLRGKLKNLQNDVENGKIPLEYPLIILFNNDSPSFDPNFFENKSEIENSLYDEEFTINDDDGKVGYRQIGFFREENIEFISKIGVYRLNFSENCRTTR